MESGEILVTPSPEYKNRRGGLIAFGVVQILIGCFLLLLATLMALIPVAAVAQVSQPNPMAQPGMRVVLALIYLVPASVFLTLGIGSVMAKNWARIGTLVVSWMWLLLGVFELLVIVFLLPAMLRGMPKQANVPENFGQMAIIVTSVMTTALFIVLPAIFLGFYHSKNVKATCLAGRAASPHQPVVILIVSIWTAIGILGLVMVVFTRYPAVVFGVVIPGIAGKLICLGTGAAYAWAIRGLWRRDLLAWRVLFWSRVFWITSGVVTFSTHNMLQLYRSIGMTEQELSLIQNLPISLNNLVWLGVLPALIFFGLLFYARRYFVSDQPYPA